MSEVANVLTQVTEYVKWNGIVRMKPNHQPQQGELPSAKFIHPPKTVGNSPYLYVELELADLECLDDQTGAVGTAIFEGSRLWKKLIQAVDDPLNSKFEIKDNGEIGIQFRGAFVTVELETPCERWWQRKPLAAGEARSEANGQWTIVESVQIYVSKGDDMKKAKGKAIRSIERQVADANNTEYRPLQKKDRSSDIPPAQEQVNQNVIGG